jgi:hypothetical protein
MESCFTLWRFSLSLSLSLSARLGGQDGVLVRRR